MVKTENLFIVNNEIKLEAELFKSKLDNILFCVLITHPHPQYGGNMFNNVVSGIFYKLIECNISCLRFNFRSVGRSTGSFSNGIGELSDVHTCVDFLINEQKFNNILLCGYSYGAAIGCSSIEYSDSIIGYVSVSFPWDFMGTKYKEMSQSTKPKLFIQGSKDNVALYENFEENFDFYLEPKYKKIIDTDHFYGGYEAQVAEEVLNFLRNLQ